MSVFQISQHVRVEGLRVHSKLMLIDKPGRLANSTEVILNAAGPIIIADELRALLPDESLAPEVRAEILLRRVTDRLAELDMRERADSLDPEGLTRG